MLTFAEWEEFRNPNSDWTLERAARRSQVDARREHLQEEITPSKQDSRQRGELTFHTPGHPRGVCPACLTGESWQLHLIVWSGSISTPSSSSTFIPTPCCATWLPGRRWVLFCFPGSKIQEMTIIKHWVGKDWFSQSQGPNVLVALSQSPGEERV